MLAQQLWAQLDVARLVDTMHVAETCSDGEVGADWAESLVDLVDVLWLRVQAVVVHRLVVDTVLFTSSNTDLHLKPLLHRRRALEVVCGGLDVPFHGLLRQVDHVRGEERLAMLLVPLLVSVEHSIEPREELLGAVVGMENDGNAVCRSDRADVVSRRNCTCDGGLLVLVLNTLAAEVGSTALRHLEDDGSFGILCSLESRNYGGGRGDVDSWDGEVVFLGELEELCEIPSIRVPLVLRDSNVRSSHRRRKLRRTCS